MNMGPDAPLAVDRPLMTIRISRDSGRTWERELSVFAAKTLPPLATSGWPPCECRRCVGQGKKSRR